MGIQARHAFGLALVLAIGSNSPALGQTYLIGGAIFADCADPLGSGVAGVAVQVACAGGFTCDATSAGGQGIWSCSNVPQGTCTVTVSGYCSVDTVCPPVPCNGSVPIVVNAANQGPNQSLGFHEGGGPVDCANEPYTIGGAVYSDCSDPIGRGEAGVQVDVSCGGGFSGSVTSFGGQGLWFLSGVPCGPCTVTVGGACSVDTVCPPVPCSASESILVNDANQGPNQSLGFHLGGGPTECTNAPYTIGGAVFSDCADPIGSGEADVRVDVLCDGGFSGSATSFGGQGLWFVSGVPCDNCTVTVGGACSVDTTCPPVPCSDSVTVVVDDSNQGPNQSLGFLSGCPDGMIARLSPPVGWFDGRQPHPIGGTTPQQGYDTILVFGPGGADSIGCWDVCETTYNAARHPTIGLNTITNVASIGPGMYAVSLAHPLTPGEITKIAYLGGVGSSVSFTTLPGDVNGDGSTDPSDIIAVIDCINMVAAFPCEPWNTDIDRSGVLDPSDIVNVIDLLNGAGAFESWFGAIVIDTGECP